MSSWLNSDDLIASVIRRTHIPESQITFEDTDILAFANEEMKVGIVPSILGVHEEFFVFGTEIPLIANVTRYAIPDRSIGAKIRNIYYKDYDDNLQEMTRVLPEDVVFYQNRTSVNFPRAFFLENNYIVLLPIISDTPTGSLVVKYFLRPNELVTLDQVSTIQSIDTTTGACVVDQIPTSFLPTSLYDFVQTHYGHRCDAINIPVASINVATLTLTFPPSSFPQYPSPNFNFIPGPPPPPVFPNTISVGDQICLQDQCSIPQIPDDLHPILAQRTACRMLEAQSDFEALQAANAKLQEMELKTGFLIDNRTEGQPQKVNNLRSNIRMGKFRRRRSTY